MSNKCVYVHKLNGEVVYVGSGSLSRASSKNRRSHEHLAVWNSLEILIVKEHLDNYQAKDLEQNLINSYWNSGKLFNRKRTTDHVMCLDYPFLSEWLYYDEHSASCLKWKKPVPNFNIQAGADAGGMSKTGYFNVKLKSKLYKCHRIVWVLIHHKDIESDLVIDHINGVRSDNRIVNLRTVSYSENNRNRLHKVSNTGLQGICEYKSRMSFSVQYKNSEHLSQICEIFSYKADSVRPAKNHYPTRELALEAALAYRNSLVDQGLIMLTNKEEINGSNR
jgi:hypothetical protein